MERNTCSFADAMNGKDELKAAVTSHMRTLQSNPDRVGKYLEHPSIRYAA